MNATFLSRVIDQQARDLGFLKLHVERPYGEHGVYIGDETTALVAKMTTLGETSANQFAQAPRLLMLLAQIQAALPDVWFADRCGVDSAVLNELEATIEAAKAAGATPLSSKLIEKLYPAGTKYANVFMALPRMLAILEKAKVELPKAWATSGGVPAEILEGIESAEKAMAAPSA